MFKNLSSTVVGMSKGMIQDRIELIEHELSNIFDPINHNLITSRDRGRKGLFRNIHDQKKLNNLFIPLLKNSPSISSLMIANELGDEYMLLKTDSIWITRITKEGSKNVLPISYYWTENETGEDILIGTANFDRSYDPRTRPWYKLAVESEIDTIPHWTTPYTFLTTKQPGITASTKWLDEVSNHYFVIGMDVLIEELSDFTTNIDLTSKGKVFIIDDEEKVIGLPNDPRFQDKQNRKDHILGSLKSLNIPVLNEAIRISKTFDDQENYISFQFEKEKWWAGVSDFRLSTNNTLAIGVVVPESDFSSEIKETRHLLMGGFVLIFLFFLIILYSFIQMRRANKIIAIERDKNEKLLLNTLPIKVVNDLKENGKSDPQKFKNVTVCFSDIVGFTRASVKLDPKRLIQELNEIYTEFDEIMLKYDCERIKTIGDAYMAVCGMPQNNDLHAVMLLKAALEVLSYIEKRNKYAQLKWKMRIGLHSGNVVGGIVGIKKYIYDVFGDTINTASRMESNSAPMRVNISKETYQLVKDSSFVQEHQITFEKRAPIEVKGKGLMEMYFVSVKN